MNLFLLHIWIRKLFDALFQAANPHFRNSEISL